MAETWCEKCENCGVLCGGKVFTNEEEFDEHPDREIGYNEDGEWFCSACRDEEEEEEDDNDSVCFRVRHEYNEKECSDNCPYKPEEEEEDKDEEEEEYIIFNCARCDVGIVNGSRAHDNCITNDGKKWWCLECSSALRHNKEEDKWEEVEEEPEEESEDE